MLNDGAATLDRVIDYIGEDAAASAAVGLQIALGGPLKAGFGYAFDRLVGQHLEAAKDRYLIQPLSGLAAEHVFLAEDMETRTAVKPASDMTANVGVGFALSVAGIVSGAAITKLVKGYRAKSEAAEIERERISAGREELNANADNPRVDSGYVIGRMEDLENPKLVYPGENKVADLLPRRPTPQENYYQNMSVLRYVMRPGNPIRDASKMRPDSHPAPLKDWPERLIRQSFTGAERNTLRNRGWTFDGEYWRAPNGD